jgi:hypothetical protein
MSIKRKKTYAYFLVPIIGLGIFIFFYRNFSAEYDLKEAQAAQVIRAEKAAKIEKENQDRLAAVAAAKEDIAKRQAERDRRDAEEARKADFRRTQYQARDKALRESNDFRERAEKLQKDVDDVKDAIHKIQEDEAVLTREKQDVEEVTQKAEANRRALAAVLEKIDAADKAAKAAAEYAAAHKKSS